MVIPFIICTFKNRSGKRKVLIFFRLSIECELKFPHNINARPCLVFKYILFAHKMYNNKRLQVLVIND